MTDRQASRQTDRQVVRLYMYRDRSSKENRALKIQAEK